MSLTTLIVLGVLPGGLIVLGGLLVRRAAPPELAGRRLLLYLLAVEALLVPIPWIAGRLAGEQPAAQIESLLSPALAGVLALVGLSLRAWKDMPRSERLPALGLGLAPLALLAAGWRQPFGIIHIALASAVFILVVWLLRGRPALLGVLAAVALASLAVLPRVTESFSRLPPGAQPPALARAVAMVLYIGAPALAVAIAAALLHEIRPASWRTRGGLASLGLAAALIGALLFRTFWFSVWDQTSDGLGGLMYSFQGGLAGAAAGLVMAATSSGRRRWAGAVFALGVPLLLSAAFTAGWDISYHEITVRRAGRIQRALERFHARQDRYPRDLRELVPGSLLALPGPVILQGEGWCYQGGAEYYRLGAFYREFFGTPLSLRIYASAGVPLQDAWDCGRRLDEMKARYDSPFFTDPAARQIPTPVSQPTSQVAVARQSVPLLIQAGALDVGKWSPDGSTLVFAAAQDHGQPENALQFVETASGRVCPSPARLPFTAGLREHAAWLPDGQLLFVDANGGLSLLRPCSTQSEDLTARFPARFEAVKAAHTTSGRLLLKAGAQYWILDSLSLEARPVAGVTANPFELHWDQFAWSPEGDRLAITRLNGQDARAGSTLYIADGRSGALLASAAVADASDQSAPMIEWLTGDRLLLHGQGDLLIYDLSSDPAAVTSAMRDLFSLDLTYPHEISAMAALPASDGGSFRLVLRANHPRNQAVYLYDSRTGQTETLHTERSERSALIFLPEGEWVEMPALVFEQPSADVYDLYRLGTETRGPQTLNVEGHLPREYPHLQVIYLPGMDRLAFASQQGVSLVNASSGALEAFWELSAGGGAAPWTLAAPDESALLVAAEGAGLYWIPLR